MRTRSILSVSLTLGLGIIHSACGHQLAVQRPAGLGVAGEASVSAVASSSADDQSANTSDTTLQLAAYYHHCYDRLVVCVDDHGGPLAIKNFAPRVLGPRDTIRVLVIGDPTSQIGVSLRLSAPGVRATERKFPSAPNATSASQTAEPTPAPSTSALGESRDATPPASSAGALPVASSASVTARARSGSSVDLSGWALVSIDVPAPDAVAHFEVQFSRTSLANTSSEAESSISFEVDGGERFVETGLMIPMIFRGKRDVVAEQVPGTSVASLAIHEDLRVVPALGVVIYPFGALDARPVWQDGEGVYYESAFRFYVLRRIGLQSATTIDFSSRSFREWYLGLTYRVYRGATIGMGLAFVRGSFLNGDAPQGLLVSGDPAAYYSDRYMARPYLALTLSTEVIQGILSTFTKIEGIASGAGTPPSGN